MDGDAHFWKGLFLQCYNEERLLFNFLWRKIDGDVALDVSLQNTIMEGYVQDEVEKSWIRFVVSNVNTDATNTYFWHDFSYDMPMWVIAEYPNLQWNWFVIGLNENIKIDAKIITTHPDLPWNWQHLHRNSSFPFKLIALFPNKPWNWDEISRSNRL